MGYAVQIVVIAIVTIVMGVLQTAANKRLSGRHVTIRFAGGYVALLLPQLAALWLAEWFLGPSGFHVYGSAVILGFLLGIVLPLAYSIYKEQLR